MDVESVYLCTKLKGKTHFILDYSQGCVYIVLGEDFYVLKEQERICEPKDSKSGCLTDKKSLDHKVETKVDGLVWCGVASLIARFWPHVRCTVPRRHILSERKNLDVRVEPKVIENNQEERNLLTRRKS
jgi:hypothetical protein